MGVITKNLGMVTAYAYAVSKGYSGTEEEFAEMLANLSKFKDDKVNVKQGADNAGKLLYVDAEGNVAVLSLGNGLAIENGSLIVTNAVVAAAICGEATCGEIICGGGNS